MRVLDCVTEHVSKYSEGKGTKVRAATALARTLLFGNFTSSTR